MHEPRDLIREATLADFVLALGSSERSPGAGSASAVAAALAAALVSMAARQSEDDQKLAAHAATQARILEASVSSTERLIELAGEDGVALAEMDDARGSQPGEMPGDARDAAMQTAVRHAVRVLREIMRECHSLVSEMEALPERGNANVAKNVDVAAYIVEAAARGAAAILIGRLDELDDPRAAGAWLNESQGRLHEIASAAARLHGRTRTSAT